MDFSFNSVELISDLKASAAFAVNSSEVFKESGDISPVIIDKDLSYMPWGRSTNFHTACSTSKNRTRHTEG